MSRLVVVGSLVVDTVLAVPRLPQPGENVFVLSRQEFLGGKGANQAVAASRMGAQIAFVGAVGIGDHADTFLELFRNEGVNAEGIQLVEGAITGNATILVGENGLNMIAVDPGVNMRLDGQWVTHHTQGADLVLTQLEVSDEALDALSPARLILNPAPPRPIPAGLLERTWLITPNETETFQLTGILPDTPDGCEEAARRLNQMGVAEVVITLGAKGVYHWNGEIGHHEPAPVVEAIDTTAAGDAFNGALAALIAQGHSIRAALPPACAYAALSTTRPGALASLPARGSVEP